MVRKSGTGSERAATSGKLDALANQAIADFGEGKYKE
jgi:hypothetical protein